MGVALATVEIKGGDKLKAALKKIEAQAKKGAMLKVGFLPDKTYPDGKPVAMIAAIQEFGAPKVRIPPRPYFRKMVAAKKGSWPADIGKLLLLNDYDGAKTLNLMGQRIKEDLQQSIIDTVAPPLSAVTVMLRGMRSKGVVINKRALFEAIRRVKAGKTNYGASTKPLVDTATMLSAVDFNVQP